MVYSCRRCIIDRRDLTALFYPPGGNAIFRTDLKETKCFLSSQEKMPAHLPVATIEEVERIKNTTDPVICNLRITQCYHELSVVLTSNTGLAANWCTFATWASKQAGQTIRKEDLARLLESSLQHSPSSIQASERMAAAMNLPGRNLIVGQPEQLLQASNFTTALDRASGAVSRGNKKVFEEIGDAFARFYQTGITDPPLDPNKIKSFCEELLAGDAPDGQGYLRQAFTHYAQALIETDEKARAELMFLANIEIGFHEQTRLQPEIAESLDAGFISFLEFARAIFRRIFPMNGWLHLAYLYLMRLFGRPTAIDLAIQDLLTEVRVELRRVITELMMTIALPSGVILKLSKDLAAGYPKSLNQITNPELCAFLEKHDLSQGSVYGTGALDWAELPDRLNYIIGLFRCYQEHQELSAPPFAPEQVAALSEGRLPSGRL